MNINMKEDLKKLQDIQISWLGTLDINIETRADQQTTMFTMTNYPVSRKLLIHKLKWNNDNSYEFKMIEQEIKELTK